MSLALLSYAPPASAMVHCYSRNVTMEEPPKLAADRMVMRLGRWLRLMGADVIMDAALDGAQLLARARDEHRVLVTRDKRLSTAPDVLFIRQNDLRSQMREVLNRL